MWPSTNLPQCRQVPNMEIDKAENKFFTSWDPQRKVFTMQAGSMMQVVL